MVKVVYMRFELKYLLILMFIFVMPLKGFSRDFRVTETTSVYAKPSTSSPVLGKIKKDKKIRVRGTQNNGFYMVPLKNGKSVYIPVASVEPYTVKNLSNDVDASNASQSTRKGRFYFDIGASAGQTTVNSVSTSYTQITLGVDYFFMDWLSWRNEVFGRFISGNDPLYGVDSSARAHYDIMLDQFKVGVYGGPGYRFVTRGTNAPFALAGVQVRAFNVNLSAQVQKTFYSWANKDYEDATEMRFGLFGSGSF